MGRGIDMLMGKIAELEKRIEDLEKVKKEGKVER